MTRRRFHNLLQVTLSEISQSCHLAGEAVKRTLEYGKFTGYIKLTHYAIARNDL